MMNDHELEAMTIFRNAWRLAKRVGDDYQIQNAELLGRLNKLTLELAEALEACERARAIAAMLENECANCSAAIHSTPSNEARLQVEYPYPTSEAADNGP